MAHNEDLHRQPIPPLIYGILYGLRVVTLPAGEELVHLGGAFWTSARRFRDLKAIGDLTERLRAASTPLRRDLAADHFADRKSARVKAVVVEAIKAYAGRAPGLFDEVLYIPGVGDGDRPTPLGVRAIRVVRRVVIR